VDGERTVKKLWEGKSGWGGGRYRLRWMDDSELDLRNMSVKRWRTKASGRTE
jgi:hypothetical protein